MKILLMILMVLVLFGITALKGWSEKPTKAILSKALRKKCPKCELYVGKGKMSTPDGLKDVTFVLIVDQGMELRVERAAIAEGEDVVILYIPRGIRDIELERFLEKVTKDVR